MHIKPKWIQDTDFVGELDVTDYCLGFNENGCLRHLNAHWDAIVYFCKTLDAAQEKAKKAIEHELASAPSEDPEACFILDTEFECATIADETLTKATIFIVLCSFKEFALKQLYHALPDTQPLPPKGGFGYIKKDFVRRGLWPETGNENEHLSENAYDSVRNNFAHGDWPALKKELPRVDLHEEFGEVVRFLREISERMRSQQLNV